MNKWIKHIIRWTLSLVLLVIAAMHSHWSVAVILILMTIEQELSAFIFVKNIKGVYLEKR